MICPKCGFDIPDECLFCPSCGSKVERPEQPEPVIVESKPESESEGDDEKPSFNPNFSTFNKSPKRDDKPPRWWQSAWFIVLMAILIWPLGILFVWLSKWQRNTKIIATIIIGALAAYCIYANYNNLGMVEDTIAQQFMGGNQEQSQTVADDTNDEAVEETNPVFNAPEVGSESLAALYEFANTMPMYSVANSINNNILFFDIYTDETLETYITTGRYQIFEDTASAEAAFRYLADPDNGTYLDTTVALPGEINGNGVRSMMVYENDGFTEYLSYSVRDHAVFWVIMDESGADKIYEFINEMGY